jgi:hypothetical protein
VLTGSHSNIINDSAQFYEIKGAVRTGLWGGGIRLRGSGSGIWFA